MGVKAAIKKAVIPTVAIIDSKLFNGRAKSFLNQPKSSPHLWTNKNSLFFKGINNNGSLLQSSKSKAWDGANIKNCSTVILFSFSISLILKIASLGIWFLKYFVGKNLKRYWVAIFLMDFKLNIE